MIPFKFNAIVVCDDVRKEMSNKDILIGVYTGDLVFPSFPSSITLAFWFDVTPERTGAHDLHMRLFMTDQTPAEFRTEINVRSLNPFSIIIPTMQLTVEQETEMHLDILDDGEWVNLKTKRIVRGGAPPPWISDPNASAPPA